jgi:hypothetical protein
MPGVWHFGFVDMWSPGYLGFAAANHNGMLRMYEIFNQGGANTKKARLSGTQLTREWFRPKPAPSGDVDWSIRNSINYAQSGVLTALELASTVPSMLVENFYRKSANSVAAGSAAPPYAFAIPAGQPDQTRVDRVVNLLRRQGIEVHRASAEVGTGEGRIPAGSYLVRLDQPYGRLARTLLEKQTYPDANLRTYDDSAWTMGLASDVEIRAIEDRAVLTSPAELVTADVATPGVILGALGQVVAVKHTGALNLVTLRYRLKDVAVRGATAPFPTPAGEFPAGSFLIETGRHAERLTTEIRALGLTAAALPAMPEVATTDVDLPRLAVYTTWANTEKVGWVRLAFDRFEIPYDLIHKDHVQPGARLRSKYDVIVVPHQTQNAKTLVYEQPKLSRPLPYRKHEKFTSLGMYAETDDVRGGMGIKGVAEFADFLDGGGVLMTFGIASAFPAEFGLTRTVDAQRPQGNWYAPGPYVQTEVVDAAHPLLYGLRGKTLPVRWAEGPLLQVAGSNPETVAFTGTIPNTAKIVLRYPGGDDAVLSGLMRGADQLRNRPALVEAPVGKGRVLLYTMNPIYRWQTFGEHGLVFNGLLYWNDLGRPAPTATSTPARP